MTLSTDTSLGGSPAITDVGSAEAVLLEAQSDLADQVGASLAKKRQLMLDQAALARSDFVLANEVRGRAAAFPPAASSPVSTPDDLGTLAPTLQQSQLLAAQIGDAQALGLTPQYVWLTQSTMDTANGPITVWQASYHPETLTQAVGDTSDPAVTFTPQTTFDADAWQTMTDRYAVGESSTFIPAAAQLKQDLDGGMPASCSEMDVSPDPDTQQAGYSIFCFEANPNLVASAGQMMQWAGEVDTRGNAAAEQLDPLNTDVSGDLEGYRLLLDGIESGVQDNSRRDDAGARQVQEQVRAQDRRARQQHDDIYGS